VVGGENGQDLSQYLINFNASDWANQVNAQLQSALGQGIQYSEKYFQPAVNAVQDYYKQARADQQQGFAQAQALQAPQRLAAYGALDAYQDTLGLARPAGGSFQLASALENSLLGQPNAPQQTQQAAGFNQGLLGPAKPKPQGAY
jgi:hypothetical protein